MKAVRIRHPASLESLYLDIASPRRAPARGEITVRLRAGSLNYRDYLVATGVLPALDGRIPLSDGAGEVVEVGAEVTGFKVGDAVVSTFHPAWFDGHLERGQLLESPGGTVDGFACEYATRPVNAFTHAPRGFTHAESATLPCAAVTAWRALVTDGGIKPGDRVLVQGTGGVSIFALQFARAAGASVIATSSGAEKLQRLKALGAEHVINYREQKEWGAAVLDLTGGLGVDHIIEVGGPGTLAQSMIAARTGAHIAIIGAVGGFATDAMPFAMVQSKRLRVEGVMVGSRRDQLDMFRAMETNGIKPVISHTFPLDRLADAFGCLRAGEHFGKVCIEI